MTGGEIIAGAKVAGELGKRALSEEEAVKANLLELSRDSPAMKEAAESYARRIQIKQGVLTKIYEPLAKLLGIQNKYFDETFPDDLAAKIITIPNDDLSSPPPSVALPAMQGLGWSLDEPDLKEMYLNLLATATDGRKQDTAHPSFAEIIKQLSAAEARQLISCLRTKSSAVPVVQLRRRNPGSGGGYGVLVDKLYPPFDGIVRDRFRDPSEGVWLENWVRLGLVEVSFSEHLVAEDAYTWVDQRPEAVGLKQYFEDKKAEAERAAREAQPEGEELPPIEAALMEIERGIIRVTAFGKRFLDAVAIDEAVVVSSDSATTPAAQPPGPPRPGI